MKYAWIEQHKDSFTIKAMCSVIGVSSSGYYASRRAAPSQRKLRTKKLRQDISKVYNDSKQIYGSYKIAEELQNDATLESACRNTVARAMQEMGLKSRVSKRFRPTTTVTDPSKRPAPNILDQVFDADAPNQKWVTDITYLPTATGFVYLAVVLDLFSRKVVGWALSDNLATSVVSNALRRAIENRNPATGNLLLHSDRGCQYTSEEYQSQLRAMSIGCSMSRTGCCYDNAVMERFFWSLKHEWTKFESFADIQEARTSVFEYIETFYNSKRIHQALDYKSPDDFEAMHQTSLAV
ncbi:MAG: IS3 family transposase [Pirellulaceae bacterium]